MSILSGWAQNNFKSSPQMDPETSRTERRPIELQTENSFCIIRRCDVEERSSHGTEHCFVVHDPRGHQLEITVSFSESAIAEAIQRSGGRLMFESAFWLTCSERHLADYLWENDDYPPGAWIIIDRLTPNDIDLVGRCGIDGGDEDSKRAKGEPNFVSN